MIRRQRKVNRPQPPSKPRYITIALAAGMFAVVPVGSTMGQSSQSRERPSVSMTSGSASQQAPHTVGNARPDHG